MEKLEPRTLLNGAECLGSVTILSHGYTSPFAPRGGPMHELGSVLFDYWQTQGSAVLSSYDPQTGNLVETRSGGRGEHVHRIIVFDWARESDDMAAGFDEAAADTLFAMLLQEDLIEADYLHLIGHSRGSMVVSEVAQRLLYYDYDVDHVTLLDNTRVLPPLDGAGTAVAWEGIRFVDHYFGDGFGGITDGGRAKPVDGAYNVALGPEADVGAPLEPAGDGKVSHFEVLEWYTQTVSDLEADEGYHWRRMLDDAQVEPPESQGPRAALEAPPSIFNGDFEYTPPCLLGNRNDFAGWTYHGGGGGADIEGQGNHYLRLEPPWRSAFPYAESEAASRTHNRLLVPPNAACLSYDVQVVVPGRGDRLVVRLGDAEIQNVSLAALATAGRVNVPVAEFTGSVQTLTVEVVAPGSRNPIDSVVHLDNFKFTSNSEAVTSGSMDAGASIGASPALAVNLGRVLPDTALSKSPFRAARNGHQEKRDQTTHAQLLAVELYWRRWH